MDDADLIAVPAADSSATNIRRSSSTRCGAPTTVARSCSASAPAPSPSAPPDCSTAATARPTGATPTRCSAAFRKPGSTPMCCSSTTATSSPAPAPRRASTPACTWCARTGQRVRQHHRAQHGRPPAAGRRPAPVHRAAGRLECRRLQRTARRLTDRLDETHTVTGLAARAHMSTRSFSRRFVAETGVFADAVARPRSASCTPGFCWRPPTLPIDESPPRCGFGSATLLRHHFDPEVGVPPTPYRRSFARGDAEPVLAAS